MIQVTVTLSEREVNWRFQMEREKRMQRNNKNIQPIRENLGRIWRGATGAFTEYIAYNALEGAVLGIFDCFTEEDVALGILEYNDAVGKGESPPGMWDVYWAEFEEFRLQFQMLARDGRFAKYMDEFNAENVLTWITAEDGRPQLASLVVNTPGGVAWLNHQIESMRRGLSEPLEVEVVGGEGETTG